MVAVMSMQGRAGFYSVPEWMAPRLSIWTARPTMANLVARGI